MAGGKLINTSHIFYRRGIPNSDKGFGLLTTMNYFVANNKQNFSPSSILHPFQKTSTNYKKNNYTEFLRIPFL